MRVVHLLLVDKNNWSSVCLLHTRIGECPSQLEINATIKKAIEFFNLDMKKVLLSVSNKKIQNICTVCQKGIFAKETTRLVLVM